MSPSTKSAPDYRRALASRDLAPGAARAVRLDDHTVAIFRTEDGDLHAVDNACPHEGYPLTQGSIAHGVLTCAWHNYKFDVHDGRCLKGDENVRAYPVRERGGSIEVDIAGGEADAPEQRWRSLREGTLELATGRVARDIARLLKSGVASRRILAEAAVIDAQHAEWGCTHVVALAADLADRIDQAEGLDAILPLLHVFALVGEPSQRRPPRPLPAPLDPGSSVEAAGHALREAVEREDAERAQALVRGAVARGFGRAEIEPWLLGIACDHFLSFGHPHIYATKVFDLLERVGLEHADTILPSLVFAFVNATREDTLPPMRSMMRHLREVEPRLPQWRAASSRPMTAAESDAFLHQVLEGRAEEVLESLTAGLEDRWSPIAVVDAVVRAASILLIDFDETIDADPTVQDGWLFATHLLTYAHAVRWSLQRYHDPELLKGLYYAAHFVHRSRKLRRPAARRLTSPPVASATATDVLDAVRARDEARALGAARSLLASPANVAPLREALEEFALADPAVRPIVIAHYVKTTRAAFEEYEALQPAPQAAAPVLAAVRLAASPVVEVSLRAAAHEAVQLIGRGRLPRRISS